MQPKKQLKVQYIGIFEEIDSFYWPKMHFLKEGQKNRVWVDPPPLFGQCPKENVFFHWGLPLAETFSYDKVIVVLYENIFVLDLNLTSS